MLVGGCPPPPSPASSATGRDKCSWKDESGKLCVEDSLSGLETKRCGFVLRVSEVWECGGEVMAGVEVLRGQDGCGSSYRWWADGSVCFLKRQTSLTCRNKPATGNVCDSDAEALA